MREHVLEIVGERPQPAFLDEQHRRRRDRLILVVQQLRDRVLDVAQARAIDHVALADAFLLGHVVDEQHHALAHVAFEQVVEVLDRARSDAHVAVLERMPHRGDVALRLDQAEQVEDAVDRARMSSRSARAPAGCPCPGRRRRTGCSAASAR